MAQQRYFQYLAGDRRNEIVMFDKVTQEDDMVFVEFKDGSRCNQEFIVPINDKNYEGKLMAEISSPENMWNFKTEWVGRQEERWETNAEGKEVCVQPFIEGRRKITPMFPRHVALPSNFGTVEKITLTEPVKPSTKPVETQEEINKKRFEGDPVWGMMEAAKKFPTPVSVELTINLPKKALFEVAEESFENGGSKVVEYIIENLDISAIKEALRQSLFESYNYKEANEFVQLQHKIVDYVENVVLKEEEQSEESINPTSMYVPDGHDAEVGEATMADEETVEAWKKTDLNQKHAEDVKNFVDSHK